MIADWIGVTETSCNLGVIYFVNSTWKAKRALMLVWLVRFIVGLCGGASCLWAKAAFSFDFQAEVMLGNGYPGWAP